MEFNSEDEDMLDSDDQSSFSSYISEEDSQLYSSSEDDSQFDHSSDEDSEEYDYMGGGARDLDHHVRRHYDAPTEERYEPVQQKK